MKRTTHGWRISGLVAGGLLGACLVAGAAEPSTTSLTLEPTENRPTIWRAGIGEGFVKGAQSIELKLSRGFGVNRGGPKLAHDLWLGHVQWGMMLDDQWGKGHWYGGNLEVIGQLFGGAQDDPEPAYVVQFNGGLRYHFATGGRLVPFLAASVGAGATDIGLPDLSTTFQFNEQIGGGVRYFLDRHRAITLEYFRQHLSNASIKSPNHGVTSHCVSLGFAWLF